MRPVDKAIQAYKRFHYAAQLVDRRHAMLLRAIETLTSEEAGEYAQSTMTWDEERNRREADMARDLG